MPDIADSRPTTLPSSTYRVDSGHGKMFIIICRDPDNGWRMREVFVKVSSTISPDKANGDPQVLSDTIIATACNRAEAEVLGKLLSTALGAGATAEELAHLMVGVNCGHPLIVRSGRLFEHTTITSIADAVGKVMIYDIEQHQALETLEIPESPTTPKPT